MNKKVWLLCIPVIFVDAATFFNVFLAYRFFENPVSAVLVALAFVTLQITSLLLFAQKLPQATKRFLFLGTAILLAVTGVSNVALSFLHASPILPADILVHVFMPGGSPQTLLVSASWMFGLALVVVGLIVWTAIGQWLRGMEEDREKEVKERKDGYKKLEEVVRTRRDGGR